MKTESKQLMETLIEQISHWNYIKPDELPNIDLYMDQVTTFMDARLGSLKRHPEDKVLTKTMINNYAKNNLLPPPEKKKYSKEHMLVLTFIYYLKSILSISDVQTLLHPLTTRFFSEHDGITLQSIYNEVLQMERSQSDMVAKDLHRKLEVAETTFTDTPDADREFLQLFSFICTLSYDVYIKKQLIERLIDDMAIPEETEDAH